MKECEKGLYQGLQNEYPIEIYLILLLLLLVLLLLLLLALPFGTLPIYVLWAK